MARRFSLLVPDRGKSREESITWFFSRDWQVGGGKFFQAGGQIFSTSLCSTMIRSPFFSSGTAVTTNICSTPATLQFSSDSQMRTISPPILLKRLNRPVICKTVLVHRGHIASAIPAMTQDVRRFFRHARQRHDDEISRAPATCPVRRLAPQAPVPRMFRLGELAPSMAGAIPVRSCRACRQPDENRRRENP